MRAVQGEGGHPTGRGDPHERVGRGHAGHTSGHARRPSRWRARPRRRGAARHRPAARSARAASASTCTCRSAPAAAATATSTPTPPPSWAAAPTARRTPTRVLAELALAARVLGDTPPPRVDTVFVGGGTPTLLPADDLARILDGIDRTWGLAADAEVTTEANPESVTPASLQALRAGRLHPDLAGHAVRRARGAGGAGPPAHAPAGPRGRRAEARDAGFDHVNLDLIYGTPGETRRGLRRLAGRGGRRRGRPRQRVRPDRGGGHPAGRPDAPRRAAVPRRRRGRGPLPGRGGRARARPASPGTRCPTGPGPRRPGAGTTCSTGPAATGGGSARRAQPRRRRALVERQAPHGVRAAAGRRGVTRAGPGGAHRRRGAHGGRDAAAAAGPGLPLAVLDAAGRAGAARALADGLLEPGRTRRAGRCSPCAAGCWPTRWSATCCPDRSRPGPGHRPRAGRAGRGGSLGEVVVIG